MKATLVVFSLVALAALCSSQAFGATQAGMSEVNIMGQIQGMSFDDDSDSTMLLLGGTYNYFLRDNISVGGTFFWSHSKTDIMGDEQESDTYYLYGRGDYYFTTGSTLAPYAGAHLGTIIMDAGTGDDSENAFLYGIQGGAKYFVSENTSINFELALDTYTLGEGSYEQDTTMWQLTVGISIYF